MKLRLVLVLDFLKYRNYSMIGRWKYIGITFLALKNILLFKCHDMGLNFNSNINAAIYSLYLACFRHVLRVKRTKTAKRELTSY